MEDNPLRKYIANADEFDRHVDDVIAKHKAINPTVCEKPTDDFLKDLFTFDFIFLSHSPTEV